MMIFFIFEKDLETARLENQDLHRICREQEEALSEMGAKYRKKVLREDGLKEANATVSSYVWRDSKEVTHCKECTLEFTLTRRKVKIFKQQNTKQIYFQVENFNELLYFCNVFSTTAEIVVTCFANGVQITKWNFHLMPNL